MPYEVWIDLADPAPQDSDDVAQAQRPRAILELIEAGWEGKSAVEDELTEEPEEETIRELLDVRVLAYPARATIGLAIETDNPVIATEVGIGLAHYLTGTPTLFGWRLESLRTETLAAPLAPGVWLPPANQPRARFPVAEFLPNELQHLCSHYLLVAAARRLTNPNDRYEPRVDADDLVSGSVEHPWGRELVGALGGLLAAAARDEAATNNQHPLLGRGGGDPELAQALLDAIRKDQAQPATDYDDDHMRGYVLVDQFMTEHGLTYNRVDGTLDPKADEYRSQDQLRSLLWAGIRTLATLGKHSLEQSRSPWLWLAEQDSDDIDPVVTHFAGRDDKYFEEADEQAEDELSTATYAHLLVRIALLHPNLITDTLPGLNIDVTSGPLHHVASEALMDLGTAAVESATRPPASKPVAKAARALLPALRAIDTNEDDGIDDLHRALEQVLLAPRQKPQQRRLRAKTFLDVITSAATAVGPARATDIARGLLVAPDMTACVLVHNLDDRTVQDILRLRILAEAAALDPAVAGDVAAHLPALHSDDPRDEPALRTQITTWWNHTINALRHHRDPTQPDLTNHECPEPGATLLNTLSSTTDIDSTTALATMPTLTAVIAVSQAISALSIALQEPDLPFDIIVAEN